MIINSVLIKSMAQYQFYVIWGPDTPLNLQKFWFHGKRSSNIVAFPFYILAFLKNQKKSLSACDFFQVSNILLTGYPCKYIKLY